MAGTRRKAKKEYIVGPIDSIKVGQSWQNRDLVFESGIHSQQHAGIHGREEEGAFSIVLGDTDTNENNEDHGDEFWYAGCGNTFHKDQEFKGKNMALARSCAAPIHDRAVDAGSNWKAGRQIRVIRKYSDRSPYAPTEGYRYDGIYKVDKYYPMLQEKEELDRVVKVYMFHFKRDDDSEPAPWTPEGRERIKSRNLRMIRRSKPGSGTRSNKRSRS